MLRTARLLPHEGFRVWASAVTVSSPSRQSATGRPGAYPDRTLTGWQWRAFRSGYQDRVTWSPFRLSGHTGPSS